MKKTILIIILFALCVSISSAGVTDKLRAVIAAKNAPAAPAGITYVESSGFGNADEDTTLVLTTGSGVESGDLVIVIVSQYDAIAEVGAGTFEDDKSNTWTRNQELPSADSTDMNIGIFTCIANGSGAIAVTITGSNNYKRGAIAAFRGVSDNTEDDVATATASTTTPAAGNISTSGSGLIVGFDLTLSQTQTITPDENWTQIAESEEANLVYSMVYRIVSGAGTYNDGWTLGSAAWQRCVTITFE